MLSDTYCRITTNKMPQPQQPVLQVALDPNVYATAIAQILVDSENFYLTLVSGNQGRRFQLSPGHAKRLLELLQKQMVAYESTYGEVKATKPQTSLSQNAQQTSERHVGFQAQ